MLAAMDGRGIRQAALVTLRRAIRERYPPGTERTRWLRWAAHAANINGPATSPLPDRADGSLRAYCGAIYGRASRCKQQSDI
jgi:hypothetical protein